MLLTHRFTTIETLANGVDIFQNLCKEINDLSFWSVNFMKTD